MSERLIRHCPVIGQYRVGKVVVLVDEHVQGNTVVFGIQEQLVELAINRARRADVVPRRLGEQVLVAP